MRRLFCAGLILIAAGCGGDADGLVPTTGTVIIDGQPGSGASVAFIPQTDTPGNGGTGLTDASGKFELTTPQGKKGLAPGSYKVTVSRRLNPDGTAADPKTPPMESAASERLGQYADRNKTPLTATVAAGDKPHEIVIVTKKK